MNSSGDAAEQVVRISLEGTEIALRLSGSAAKNIAAALYTVLKNRDRTKTKGYQRLSAMLKSGKELKVFTIADEHLKRFQTEAKRYGVVYCALRGKGKTPDGLVDVMVRAEDASKINRIVERFKFATVDAAAIKQEIKSGRTEKAAEKQSKEKEDTGGKKAPEKARPEKTDTDRLLDDLLGKPAGKEEREAENPTRAGTGKSTPSARTSERQGKTAEGTVKKNEGRPSVREEMRQIRQRRKETEKTATRADRAHGQRKAIQPVITHRQPKRKTIRKPKAR